MVAHDAGGIGRVDVDVVARERRDEALDEGLLGLEPLYVLETAARTDGVDAHFSRCPAVHPEAAPILRNGLLRVGVNGRRVRLRREVVVRGRVAAEREDQTRSE